MKSLAIVMLMLVGSLFAQDRPQRSQRMAGTDAGVRQRMDQVWQAWDSKDLKRVSQFYVKDADAVFFDFAPLKYNGWAEYEKGVAPVLALYKTLNIKVAADAKVHQQGDWAWAAATLLNDSVLADGKTEKEKLRWTSIWQKRGKEWFIVHEHISGPAS